MKTILGNSVTLNDIKNNIEILHNKYQDLKITALDDVISNIQKNMYSSDANTLVDVKNEISQCIKIYNNYLTKKITRLIIIRNNDINLCTILEQYINFKIIQNNITDNTPAQLQTQRLDIVPIQNIHEIDTIINTTHTPHATNMLNILDILNNISLEDIDIFTNNILKKYNYNITNIETVLINSDLSVNFNINLIKLSKILQNKGWFNTYEPDEHSGVNLKYYFNTLNDVQGICNCEVHCASKEKYPVCAKVTILIFRPGSIIITGSRSLEHLNVAHKFILTFLQTHMTAIKIIENKDDTESKNIALYNNECRKISKKTRLFYVQKKNIIVNL